MDLNFSFKMPSENKTTPLNEDNLYDLLIIGAGPAGLTAAVYAMRKGLDVALITANIGGQVTNTYSIENYLGYKIVEGTQLADKFFEQVNQFPIAFKDNTNAISIEKHGTHFKVYTDSDESYTSKTLIICAGKTYRKLGVKGESEYTGKGVAYCTTCDAPLYRDKTVAVVGGGNSAVESAIELCKITEKVTLLQNLDKLTADSVLIEKLSVFDNINIFYNSHIEEILGDDIVRKIIYTESDNKKELYTDGIFIEIGLIPNTTFLSGITALNNNNEILVDCACRTSEHGIFAAGDITSVPVKQIIVAAGEGAKAAVSAFNYLMQKA
ncbi:FAD-dependent oxidoreductase [Elusimicrobiota bacterium]